ncbi:MAG: hypothetical protein ACREC5_03855, partial [Thermoplasmata archaeon]
PAPAPGSAPVAHLGPGGVSPSAAPAIDADSLRRAAETATLALLEPRLAQAEEAMLARLAGEIQQAVGGEVDRRVDQAAETKLKGMLQVTETRLAQTLTELDTRYQERLQRVASAAGSAPPEWRAALDTELRGRVDDAVRSALDARAPPPEEGMGPLEGRLGEFESRATQQWTAMLAATESRLRESLPGLLGAEIDRRLKAILEQELADPVRGERGRIARRIDARLEEAVRLSAQASDARYGRSLAELEARWEERARSWKVAGAPLVPKELESVQPLLDRAIAELAEAQHQALETRTEEIGARESSERAALGALAAQQMEERLDQEVEARAESEGRLRQGMETRLLEGEQRRSKEHREMETRLTSLVETRGKEAQSRLQTSVRELESRLRAAGEERVALAETRTGKALDGRFAEGAENQAHVDADLQVRLQSYTDQKLRESEEHHRQTTVELVSRVRGEVEAILAKGPDFARVEPMLKDRIQRAGEAIRSELRVGLDDQLHQMEDRIVGEQTLALQKLELLERDIRDQTGTLLKVEESMRGELDDLDRRLITLADRLLPVVRKTWLKLAEIEKNPGSSADMEARLSQIRREFKDEVRRVDTDLANRARDLRDRLETTLTHQGKVWLTLVHSLQQLT